MESLEIALETSEGGKRLNHLGRWQDNDLDSSEVKGSKYDKHQQF